MQIVVVHGSARKGNTYQAAQKVLSHMRTLGELSVQEYYLPQDLPHFCMGCMACFEKGEDACPHAKYTLPLRDAMEAADALIFTTPVYAMRESGGMKAFLDHFAFQFMVHRPRKSMFSKKALVLCTTAGGGMGAAIKAVRTSLVYWGVNRVYTQGLALRAASWDDLSPKRRARLEKRLTYRAEQLFRDVLSKKNHIAYPILHITYLFAKLMLQGKLFGISSDSIDSRYWREQGYFASRPF